jgi:hypothetical protein
MPRRQRPEIRLLRTQETRRRQALVKKARQRRANIANLQKVPDSQTAWWWAQSDANPSPCPDSLLTGKFTGNFVESVYRGEFQRLVVQQIQCVGVKFPTQRNREFFWKEQGIYWRQQGI